MNSNTFSDNLKAILFDLDGTLIDVNLKLFIPGYIKLISESVSHLIPPRKFIRKLLKASEAVNNNNGKETNDTIFAKHFFPIEGYSRDEIQPYFDIFYEKDFVKLKKYTTKKPESRNIVQYVCDKGYDVIIATTPVLPLTAIQQRLDWAGVGDFSYRLITTIENSRASKPNLIYYQQIIDYLGYPPESCLMVGDEDKDMVAANINCPTFLNYSDNTKITPDMPKPTFQGNLLDLINLL